MWEIDVLLKKSIEFVKDSNLDNHTKKNILWNLESIPTLYEFDAGNFKKTELDKDFKYQKLTIYKIAEIITITSNKIGIKDLTYDWSAFLLNFWQEYFSDSFKLEDVKSTYLLKMKEKFIALNFETYQPIHTTLTIYKNGNEWFSSEQNELIKWYCG